MKTLSLTILAAVAILSGSAFAGTVHEHCVTRVLDTNYNSGMEGQSSTVCTPAGGFDGNAKPHLCETKRS